MLIQHSPPMKTPSVNKDREQPRTPRNSPQRRIRTERPDHNPQPSQADQIRGMIFRLDIEDVSVGGVPRTKGFSSEKELASQFGMTTTEYRERVEKYLARIKG